MSELVMPLDGHLSTEGSFNMQAETATAETLRGPPGLALGAGVDLRLQLTTMTVFGDAGEFMDKVQLLCYPAFCPARRVQC